MEKASIVGIPSRRSKRHLSLFKRSTKVHKKYGMMASWPNVQYAPLYARRSG